MTQNILEITEFIQILISKIRCQWNKRVVLYKNLSLKMRKTLDLSPKQLKTKESMFGLASFLKMDHVYSKTA